MRGTAGLSRCLGRLRHGLEQLSAHCSERAFHQIPTNRDEVRHLTRRKRALGRLRFPRPQIRSRNLKQSLRTVVAVRLDADSGSRTVGAMFDVACEMPGSSALIPSFQDPEPERVMA